jgi:hypothetical protein
LDRKPFRFVDDPTSYWKEWIVGTAWIVTLGIGTILLGLVMWLAMARNRKHESPAELARSDAGTRKLYAEEDAAEHARDDVQR